MNTDRYDIRFVAGRTIRAYKQADALVDSGDHVVMEKQLPIARFRTDAAAEVFCQDYKGPGWLVLGTNRGYLRSCPMCHTSSCCEVTNTISPIVEPEFICRACGYHNKLNAQETPPADQSR